MYRLDPFPQVYRPCAHFSWVLLPLTGLDLLILLLIQHEYVCLKQRRGKGERDAKTTGESGEAA